MIKNVSKLINRHMKKWTYCLGLRWWEINVYYIKKKQAKKIFKENKTSAIAARTYADWRYSTASIYFNIPFLKTLNPETIEAIVVHELCHVLVNEMQKKGKHHEERVVTGLTKAFLWTDEKIEEEQE